MYLFIKKISVVEIQTYKEKQRQREISYLPVNFQMTAKARAELIQSKEPLASSGLPIWVQELWT